ncbi:MAG: dTDP-4-dehydrorhamnose reductase [Acidobacteria bacterium]|nr:dTDP-4-dehydrorhamnose reductase [Acidobacteriota bacterium]
MKVLLLGRRGQVGSALVGLLAPLGEVFAAGREELDMAAPGEIREIVRRVRPDIIVNAAAYNAVDRAESEPDAAFAVNAIAPGVLGEESRKLNALLVHYSTDYVYDGAKAGAYLEDDPPGPINAYGKFKLAGDHAIAASGCRHFIFRTSWVYGARGGNFLLTILRAARERPELRVVDDQRGAPTSAVAIAEATVRALARPEAAPGIYHLSAAGETTWHGFAAAILEAAGLRAQLHAIRSEEYITAARRPRNSLLDNAKLRATFGVALPDWRAGLAQVMRELA